MATATATRVRSRFRLATGVVIRPGFWFGDHTGNDAVPFASLQAMVDAARAETVASSLMAGFDDTVVFEEWEAQSFAVREPDGDHPTRWWEATTITVESSGADIPGTQTLDSLPPRNAFVISIWSSVPGPSGRNRYFGPPPCDSEVNALGVIDSARVSQLEADYGSIWSEIVNAAPLGAELVVASAVDDDLHEYLDSAVKTTVKSQRRRQR